MQSITALRASSRAAHLRNEWHSFFSVPKNDSATALPWQLPVRPTDSLTSRSPAQRAGGLEVYCEPRMPF